MKYAAALALFVSVAACGGEDAVTASGAGGSVTGAGGGGASASSTSEASVGSSASTSTSTSTTGTGGAGGGGGGGSGGAAVTGSGGAGGAGGAGAGGSGGTGGSAPLTVAQCFANAFVNPPMLGPDYDQFGPVVGSHCLGTNHQAITGVERVVFLGDSVTVGTPPTFSADYYRNELADALATTFGLTAPDYFWQTIDIINGTSLTQDSGDFASCAKWGARTDDLLVDNTQITDCFPASELTKRTLVIMTMGGNDLSALTQAAIDGATDADLWAQTQDFVQKQRDAVSWFFEPGRFPNGVFVIFGNMYEFTDGTGNVQACDVSALAGFDQPVPSPAQLADMVIWANEQYASIAVDTGADMIFMLEEFCGHGFEADNPAAPCYRGPNTDTWFDLTCIHPNSTGHDRVKDMFMAVVNE